MPNWCFNVLTITGDGDVNNFYDENKNTITEDGQTTDTDLDFSKSVPCPENIYQGPLGSAEREIHGPLNWYTWNCDNWGTKWNAAAVSKKQFPDKLTYCFDTAWSPPLNWLKTTAIKYNNLEFKLEFSEEGEQFEGEYIYKNGIPIKEETWDPIERIWEENFHSEVIPELINILIENETTIDNKVIDSQEKLEEVLNNCTKDTLEEDLFENEKFENFVSDKKLEGCEDRLFEKICEYFNM
jgi:hypothetical protein